MWGWPPLRLGKGCSAEPGRGPGAGLAEIFGKDKSFSANAHTTVKSPDGKETQMEMSYAVLEGKVRTETDMTKMQGGRMPPEAVAQMQPMGMDKTVTIILPEKHTGYLVYPGLKSYCELPTPAGSSATESNKPPKVERTEIGKETVDGHPCVKYKVVVTPENGTRMNMLVWQATDLNNSPIQTQVEAGNGMVTTTRFQNIKQSKPAASLFEPPSDYKRYGSLQELMMSNMRRNAGRTIHAADASSRRRRSVGRIVGLILARDWRQSRRHEKSATTDVGRAFRRGPAEAVKAFTESVSFDWRLYKHDIAGSIAHAKGLAKAGVLTKAEAAKIERGLRAIEREIEVGQIQMGPVARRRSHEHRSGAGPQDWQDGQRNCTPPAAATIRSRRTFVCGCAI